MPAPWIEAWKAWLSRVAERFVQAEGPAADPKAKRVPPLKAQVSPAQGPLASRKGPPHRSGQRHG